MARKTGFSAMVMRAVLILVVSCVITTVAAVVYDQRGSSSHYHRSGRTPTFSHTPVGVAEAATNGCLAGLAIGTCWALFQVAVWLWGGKRDGLADLQHALETQAAQAHREGRLGEEQRLRREIADIERDRARDRDRPR